jgi:molecular chaperone GrpE
VKVLEKQNEFEQESSNSKTEEEQDIDVKEEEIETDEVQDVNDVEENKEILELRNSLQRLQADFNNFRKRTEKEKTDISTFANEKLICELLLVLDNFERALDSNDDKEAEFYKGVSLIYKQIIDTLSKFGLETIESDNEEFDPNFHHAVMQEEVEDVEPQKILETFQKGYKLKSRVIRPSMVKVSK